MTKNIKTESLHQALNNSFEQAQGVKGWDTRYVHKSVEPVNSKELNIKAIAFYLPQFHPIPENDAWWGKGFTEWTNVSKAVPQFVGHHQPHLPGELGFYDLRLPEVLQQQAALARHYGIHGFCFHHYWFGGKRLLERPLQLLLEHKEIDINFCLCWANENWSRRWDGAEHDVLMEQDHSPEDDIAFIDSLFDAFEDERYIRVDGKPLLIVYRATLLPDAKETAKRWRDRAVEKGFDGLYIVAAKSFDIDDPSRFGFDAAVEFPPHKLWPKDVTSEQEIINPNYTGNVYDYEDAAEIAKGFKHEGHLCFRTVMPSWDNEARRPGNGFSFVKSTPENYAGWLDCMCKETMNYPEDKRMLFINAWNEWAEGAHLEPDRRHGYAYLHTTANVLRRYSDVDSVVQECELVNSSFEKKSNNCIVVHLYYQDLADELINHIKASGLPDLFISISNDGKKDVIHKFLDAGINAYFLPVENIGRDIRPFLQLYINKVLPLGYEVCGKIHTKKSLHRIDGDIWRENLFNELFNVKAINEKFALNPNVALIAPSNSITDLSVHEYHAGNIEWLSTVLELLNKNELTDEYNFNFVAGSMFWFKVDYMTDLTLLSNLLDSFELELGQLDGTLAHTIERVFALLVEMQDGEVIEL